MRTFRFRAWHRWLWCAAVWCLLRPALSTAQSADSLAPGAKLRLTEVSAYQPIRHVGRLVAISRDSIWLARGSRDGSPDPVSAFFIPSVSRVEISRGQYRRAGEGLGFGVGIGASLGAVVGGSAGDGTSAITFGILGAGVGLVLGTIVGSFLTTEEWKTVPSSRWHPGASP
ncbi:hypothetical protein GAU_3387 [Gemmatimonas aurantiaca T-27]|uniref:Glycine zipper domain-containing protein n=1 Tax=Gemmatimonas aurantiaca (strain DSM 14586 / JCM 11422 / NBRC 100505 / T-27) TaxID=379066 RepID=C1AD52_GEMAT|nr:hypothetical protein GAU_3387 [Gemmatimonas aurantiaca T-27]